MFMAPDSWKGLFESTLAAAQKGEIPLTRLNDAVRRILRVKHKLGLMGPTLIERGDVTQIGAPAHLELAREAVAKSLVLLKNNNNVLPIKKGANVLIAGRGADNMAMQAGGWTITWQGTDTKAADFPNGQTIGRALVEAVQAQGGKSALSTDGQYQSKPDVAIVVVGETPYAEFEGDKPNLAFATPPDDEAMIARLKAGGIPVVLIFLSGRPLFAGKLFNQADAFVAAWLPGTQGQGVADVLVAGADGTTRRDFTGRLSFPWPADARAPMVKPLFKVGYGLDYKQRRRVAAVNEDPRMELGKAEQATAYIVRGKVPAPWFLGIDGAVVPKAIDLSAQEDARQFTWAADGAFAISGPAVDLSKQASANGALLLDWRIDQAAQGPVKVSMGSVTFDLRDATNAKPIGAVMQTYVPLTCFQSAGAKLDALGTPFRIEAQRGFSATIRSVRIATDAAGTTCPPHVR
jgi:beta-glucosidase